MSKNIRYEYEYEEKVPVAVPHQTRKRYIRSFSLDRQLDPEVKNILDRIPHFSYNLTKGFLQWTYGNGLQEGTFSDRIETEGFQEFQNWIKRNRPITYEEIEGLLL